MTAALRNVSGNTSARKILGTPWNGLLAEQIAAETATGDHGEGALYNEATQPAYAGKRLSMRVTSSPGVGTLRVEENGAVTASDFPDGVYVVPYDFYVESVFDSASTFTLTFGSVDATVTGGTGTGTGSGTGGDALGAAGGDAVVSGGTGSSIGSGTGGDAVGVVVGIVWPLASDVRIGVVFGPTGSEYVGTMAEGSGTYPTPAQIAAAVVSALQATTTPVNVVQFNGNAITGTGRPGDPVTAT